MKQNKPKVLLYDIETSYTVGAVWGLYEQNVVKVLREPYIISVAWKWLGEKTTQVVTLPNFATAYKLDKHSDIMIVKYLRELFDKADVIIAHNGNAFDQKWVYGRFAVYGINPPSPAKYIDTLLIARNKFKFNSNRLNDLSKYFSLGEKVDTGGIDLWVNCIEKDCKKSWKLMAKYNKQDVVLLEKVYKKLLPYITNHPNLALMNGETQACPNCSGFNVIRRGFNYTKAGKFQQWQCEDCGSWHSSPLTGNKQIR